MTAYVVPVLFLIVLITSLIKKKDAYSYFIDGSRSAVDLMIGVFPYLMTIMMCVEIFRQTGVSAAVSRFVSPVFEVMGLPGQLTELILLRPLSGAGSLAILDNIYATYGTDTFVGRCASIIYGSSETVFYVSAIYLSQSKTKKLRYALPVALVSTLLGCIIGCALLRVL
ncbi:MAG: hypothetical protein J1F36_06075 [Clostridiales bacterium]|nr:hypothetical protein [Clostridiales bacterium]